MMAYTIVLKPAVDLTGEQFYQLCTIESEL
jgi:hypothetical protein